MKVAIIGGGITGVATAKKFSSEGNEVSIFEKNEALMSETSSKTTGLIHGGIRYLESLQFSQVKKGLKDRDEWLKLYPDCISSERFIIPILKSRFSNFQTLKAYLGVKLYDLLSQSNKINGSSTISNADLSEIHVDLSSNVSNGVYYYDCRMNEKKIMHRLEAELLSQGINIVLGANITKINDNGSIEVNSNNTYHFDLVINCTGPWVSKVLFESNSATNLDILPVKGSHLVVRKKINFSYLLETTDKRYIFWMPHQDGSVIGTTEVHTSYIDNPTCSDEEATYLLDEINQYSRKKVDKLDIIRTFSGVRPVIKKNTTNISNLPREFMIEKNNKIINVFGGKWTSAFSMARDIHRKSL